jgi:polyhydroxyalkanoate synthase
MENKNEVDMIGLANDVTKVGQKMSASLLENMPAQLKSFSEFSASYLAIANKVIGNPEVIAKGQSTFFNFLQNQVELSKRLFEKQADPTIEHVPVISPAAGDKRFKAAEWNEAPYYFDYVKQNYLLISQMMLEIVDSLDLEKKSKSKLNFQTQQYLDALSPANFFATNPEAIKLANETNGQSLMKGFENLLGDLAKGSITQSDESTFEIGRDLANTKGSVVYENELIQLIQYDPLTEKVSEIPLLILPPWINKFYILDLHADRSLVEYCVKQGQTVFMISWKNPTADMGYLAFEDYVVKGALKAIEVSKAISGAKKIDTLGYCLGGTLLGITLSIIASEQPTFLEAEREKDSINSATFLAAMLDFSDVGTMGAIIDEELVSNLENELKDGGVMKGEDMAKAFNAIRANELVWHYVANNYLMGKTPPPFSVLYWSCDNTNLPARMYTYYMRKMIFENKLRIKNALRICNVPIDLGRIKVPTFVIGTIDDHISPCRTAFTTTELLSGEMEFVLGDSGHIMGAINAPSKKHKYNFKYGGILGQGYEHWQKTSKQGEGSWWPNWSAWIAKKSVKSVPAPKHTGNKNYPNIEPAPGRYVKEKTESTHKINTTEKAMLV